MDIKILGTGCAKCKKLEEVTRKVVEENKIGADITKVDDIVEILKYNVMVTPALVIDNKVAIRGRVPSADEIKSIILKYS